MNHRCPACADVVGVYERAILVLRGGGLVDGSPLTAVAAGDVAAIYHHGCLRSESRISDAASRPARRSWLPEPPASCGCSP